MIDPGDIPPCYLWIAGGALLATLELVAPGAYLIFLAAAAALTGLFLLVVPLPLAGQLLLFAALAIVATYLGRMIYRGTDVRMDDPLLNDRAGRLVGQTVTVVAAVDTEQGRARVGDGEWPARGAALPVGARARIVSVDNGVLQLAALD